MLFCIFFLPYFVQDMPTIEGKPFLGEQFSEQFRGPILSQCLHLQNILTNELKQSIIVIIFTESDWNIYIYHSVFWNAPPKTLGRLTNLKKGANHILFGG